MSNWRGGTRPSFPNHSSTSASSSSTSTPFNSISQQPITSFQPGGERGRGRGRGRGGLLRGRGGGIGQQGGGNLSWKRSDNPSTTTSTSTSTQPQVQPEPSSFEAFGNGNTSGGGAFGSSNNNAFSSSAFSNPSFGAFGGGGGGGATTSSAFGTPSTSTNSTPSAFPPVAQPSAFSSFQPSNTTTAFPSSSAFSMQPSSGSQRGNGYDDDDGAELEGEDEGEEEEEMQEEGEDENETEPVETMTTSKRNPAQISTLEVLGEDSDARRKRFESTLANNRYLELKPLREEQRLLAIKQGLIPDPSKPMRLDEATDFEGTCQEMCPEWEREEREYQNNVDPLERYPGTSRIDPARAVKAFHRPAAGNDQALPSDVRPPAILHETLDYLFHHLLPLHPLHVTHPFLRDRTRSIRQDFTVQNVRGMSAIECNERIARYHILALGSLREQSGFSESQELEQLRKVLKSLNEFYDDLRLSDPTVHLPNEAEFRSYHLLTHLRDPDIIWSTELLPLSVFSHPLLQTALELHRLAQRSNQARGERSSPNAFSRFFKLVETERVPYLFGCILSTHFNEIRKNALEALRGAFLKQHSAFPVKTLTKVLGCDDEADTRSVLEQFGIVVRPDERGMLVAELYKGAVFKSTTLKLRVSKRLVEAKRGPTSYQTVIDGGSYTSQRVQPVPTTPSIAQSSTSSPSFTQPPQKRSSPITTIPRPTFAPASLPATAVPTPVATPPPPPPTTFFGSSSANTNTFSKPPNLNAAAPAFVPSFNTQLPPPRAPSTSFSFASTAPANASTSAQSAPAFSFAPTAPPFVPASSQSFTPPTLPSNVPRPSIPASISFIPKPQPAPVPVLPSIVPPQPAPSTQSPTLRRISGVLSRPSPPRPTPRQIPRRSPPQIDRKPLIDSLVKSLTRQILIEGTSGSVRRCAQEALKERWGQVEAREELAKREMSRGLREDVVRDVNRLLVREVAVTVRREEKMRREVLEAWRERMEEQKQKRKENEGKQRAWNEVVKRLDRVQATRLARDEDADEYSDDEVELMEDEEDAGVAGTGDVGLELGGLSIGGGGGEGTKLQTLAAKRADDDMAERLRKAADTRQRIWAKSTFLNILSSRFTSSLNHCRLPSRPTWTTLVVTSSTESSFATWLSCKFELDDEGRAEVDTPHADLVVQLSSYEDDLDDIANDAESTGLIVFDCTSPSSDDLDWTQARNRLRDLVEEVDRQSLYLPALLLLTCPSHTLTNEEASAQRNTIASQLDLDALSPLITSSALMFVQLDGAEAELESSLAEILTTVSIREDRIRRPLSTFAKPLFTTWRTSLRKSLDRFRRDETAAVVASSYIEELRTIIDSISNVAVPDFTLSPNLPSFKTSDESFSSTVHEYISQAAFASAGHFPDIATAFARRPPPSDYSLSRLLLELVGDYVFNLVTSPRAHKALTTIQQFLDEDLTPTLRKLEDSLVEVAQDLQRRDDEIAAKTRREPEPDSDGGGKKKRKASLTSNELAINRSPKKTSVNGFRGSHSGESDGMDRLSALELLMKDAKALLAA